MSDIFLSYKSEERTKARIIAEALERHGYSVWWDRIIPIGQNYDDVIEEELDASKCLVVLWSKESVKSKWVKTEAGEGDRRGILVPILIEEVTPPLAFRRIEAAKLMDWDGTSDDHEEFNLLLDSIARILGRFPAQKKDIKKLAKGIFDVSTQVTASTATVTTVPRAPAGAIRGSITPDNPKAKPSWDAQSFAGFFYDLKYDRKPEKLYITRTMSDLQASRTINKEELVYKTEKAPIDFKVFEKEGLNVLGSSSYSLVGWMAEKWIAINDKANKLVKLVFEMGQEDMKTLTTGETWPLGSGYEITINAIDTRATPGHVWFTLKKNRAVVDEGIGQAPSGSTFADKQNAVYYKTKTILGESNALLFAVYVDSIFSGATSDMVQFKYAWLIDESTAMEVKAADKFGIFEVRTALGDEIMLSNENTVSLIKNTEITIMGNIKFKVADNDILRFYPKVD
ncbi:MAG: TIR domain-containing protein [Candidatus Methanoperedens sp.]|nr:TIR domain-containing protein [Candidatus Methanoperedens sp.]